MARYIDAPAESEQPLVRFEPWLNRALAYASAQGFVSLPKGKAAVLTATGKQQVAALRASENVMQEEMGFVEVCARALSEGDVARLLRSGK